MRWLRQVWGVGLLTVVMAQAWAQEICTCTDAKGRKLNSDRPITECTDREQKVLGRNGTVKRVVGPVLSAQEQADYDEAQRREAEDQMRVAEEKRRERALFSRYPNQASHDKERAEALSVIEAVISSGQVRVNDLAQQRKELDGQMEFYKKDSAKAPASLKRRILENDQSRVAQARFIAEQEDEKKRINQRFDEELIKLRPRWAFQNAAIRPAASSASAPGR